MKQLDFYCKKCKKSLKISYVLTGDMSTPVLKGIVMRCHTNKCVRTITLMNMTEGDILKRADKMGRVFI